MAQLSRSGIEARISAIETPTDADALVTALRSAADRTQLLGLLAESRDLDVRSFVADHAVAVLGRDAIPILRRLSRDRNADVRSIAIEELINFSPSDALSIAPALRRQVRRGRHFEPIFAMWQLARLGDAGALEVLGQVAESEAGTERGDVAEAAMLLIHGRDAEVRGRLLEHDHGSTKSLAMALTIRATRQDRETLARGAADLPDEACRRWCSTALSLIARDDSTALHPYE
jgi:hypothetical protein